jgi:phage terminase large subunit-like protein
MLHHLPTNPVHSAIQYADDVATGKVVACRWVQLACKRALSDWEAAAAGTSAFFFDERQAARVCAIIESFPHVKGEWARNNQRIRLEPWQCFILANIFGWKRKDTSKRRFVTVYLEVARKNAKSTLASGIGVYLLACDNEPGAVIVSAATTRDQARLCFADAQQLMRKEPGFCRHFGVQVRANAITCERTGSTFKPLSAEGSHQDGLNIHGALIDEVHAMKDRRIYDVIETGTGARQQPLLFAISTAGFNQHGIGYELRGYLTKVLDNAVADESFFGLIYTLDEGDNWQDERVWSKPNPNLGVSVYLDDLRRQALKASQTPSAQMNYLTKRMNMWVNANSAWIDTRLWQAAAVPRTWAQAAAVLAGEACYIGIDLATKSDLLALCLWFPPAGARTKHTLVFRFWVPEFALQQEDNGTLADFARRGAIEVHRGKVADFEMLADDLEDIGRTFNVLEMAADPWQLPPLLSILNRRSFEIPIEPTRQVVATMSPAMKETANWLLADEIEHDGNPAMTWQISNVVCHYDAKENIYPRKAHKANKIDGCVAMFLAADRVLKSYSAQPNAYDTREEVASIPLWPTAAASDIQAGWED